ncbi:2-isopropylmalate synthase [Alkalimarinus coralli]|uniref:2-isopropylmalate synthase n=1 Tax=Alkalimarinus coralli TaxID=2935863 RepID=UPI00202ADB61|nr:2-isopropylmalate synthase [Alkalimarinus coralli]
MSGFNHQKYRPFAPIKLANRTWPDNVITQAPDWCSVDLRDGNQALIEPMFVSQKQMLFALLVKVGFKEIEVGFPAASQPDFDFVRWLIEENQVPDDVTLQVLTQARPELIERTFESLKGAKRAVVHVYNSTSTVQREQVFKLDKQGIIDIAVRGARKVKELAEKHPETEWVYQYSPESFTGTELDFAVEVVDAVTAVWQPTPDKPAIINLPATVEMATPNVFADQIEWFCNHVSNRDSIIISVHTHNDRGCGVAAAELAVMAGAQRVEGTMLGNGERTGNMDIVTMAMNLYSQGIDPELYLADMDEIVRVVKACTQLPVHPRHPYAGELVYTAFSGSHQDAIKKCLAQYNQKQHASPEQPWQVAYLPIDPTDLGRSYQEVIRVNSQSGKGGVAYALEQVYGVQLPRWLQIAFSGAVQQQAELNGGEVSAEDMWQLFSDAYIDHPSPFRLGAFDLKRTTHDQVHAQLISDAQAIEVSGEGHGVMDAFAQALRSHCGVQVSIQEYSEHALQEGSDADAVAYLQLSIEGQQYVGVAIHEDTVAASLNAMLSATNQYMAKQQQAVA